VLALVLGVCWVFCSSFLDVLLSVLFLDSCSWRFVLVPGVLVPGVLVTGLRVLGVAIASPGGFRLSRLLRVVTGELWLGVLRVFRGRVCAVGEDILLSESGSRSESKDNGRAAWAK
jgi:hypothetical protein